MRAAIFHKKIATSHIHYYGNQRLSYQGLIPPNKTVVHYATTFYPSGECRLVVNLVLVTFKLGVGVHIGIEVISGLLFWDVNPKRSEF